MGYRPFGMEKTIKHINPNKTNRLGKKMKKKINVQGLLFETLE
jgi:hypothetical protein